MISRHYIKSIAAFLLVFGAFSTAHAQTIPTIDNFDNMNSVGWDIPAIYTDHVHNILLTQATSTSDCYVAQCVTQTSGVNGQMELVIPFQNSGYLNIYAGAFAGGDGQLDIYVSSTTNWIRTSAIIHGGVRIAAGTGFHSFSIWWRPNASSGNIEECSQEDNLDPTGCTWTDTGHANNTPLNNLFVSTGMYSGGDQFFIDELTGYTSAGNGTVVNVTNPAVDSVIAPSLHYPFEIKGYLSSDDYAAGATADIAVAQITGQGLRGNPFSTSQQSFNHDFSGAGNFDFADNASFTNTGIYQAQVTLQKPLISVFGVSILGGVFVNKFYTFNFNFTVGTSTPAEQATAGLILQTAFTGGSVASTTNPTDVSCAFFSATFDVTGCLRLLILPNDDITKADVSAIQTGFLARFPWGYATRLSQIFSNQSSTSLPTFTPTINLTGNPADNIPLITVNPNEMLAGGASVLSGITDPNSGLNFRQLAEPLIQMFIAFTVIVIIAEDITRMRKSGRFKK